VKASYHWIRALVPKLEATPAELAARFSAAGLEVEAVHEYGEACDACVVAVVQSTRPHPTKSGLSLVTVDRGGGASLEVVCGASNVPPPGGLVVLAPLGARLPAKGVTIERRSIAGVESAGMLCSESELGIGDGSDGILVLPQRTGERGVPLSRALPSARDTIFEIGLTPNRPDCLGHIGLAREAAALHGLAWTAPEPDAPGRAIQGSIDSYAKVHVEDAERCPHYAAAVVVDVTIAPSPAWVRYRLASLGIRPISNVVDVTNLVLLEYGHPMHAFDLDRVRGGVVVVRRAKEGEKLVTLDGVTRVLVTDDLVVCDGEGPVALAGVMGGASSEISPATKRVMLECAYFDPRGVRRSARRHGLHTESSHRFERGVDRGDIPEALTHAAALLTHLAGGAAVPGVIHAVGAPLEPKVLELRAERLERVLGVTVPFHEATAILERLGCTLRSIKQSGSLGGPPQAPGGSASSLAELAVPTHRPDIAREIDLVEEVARVRGMDAIPTELPAVRPSRDEGPRERILAMASRAGVEMGLSEAVTYAFVSRASLAKLSAPEPAVILKNPLNEGQEVMRTSLLPGLLGALANARRRGERDVRLFTVGAVFLANAADPQGLPEERLAFAALVAGERAAYLSKPEPVDVWDGKGLALGLVRRLAGIGGAVRAFMPSDRPAHLHPRGAGRVLVALGGEELGLFGLLHPDVIAGLDLGTGPIVVVEMDLARLAPLATDKRRAVSVPRFPAATRDVALVVREDVAAGDVLEAVRSAAGELAEHVALFDRFLGGSIARDHQSLAFHVVYRAKERTLTDAEVDAQHAKVVAEVNRRFGATLRG
jgi:phenylalanyl-tRNA synthetase beta chain